MSKSDGGMSKGWKERSKAQEESFFEKENNRLLEEMADKKRVRLSPVSGEPMREEDFEGVTIDRCQQSGGIWLDAGELEEIIGKFSGKDGEEKENWLENLLGAFSGK